MKQSRFLFPLFLALPLVISSAAHAIQRKHRPWLSGKSKETVAETDISVGKGVASQGDVVVQQALRYKGTRYKFGGTSKRGVDCSGLVNRVWEDLKLKKIPRASSALYKSGKPIHLAELRAGDLVFFKNTYKRGISHVGVYTGNNKFVHAAGRAKGVTITKLSDPYYQLHYAGARRLY